MLIVLGEHPQLVTRKMSIGGRSPYGQGMSCVKLQTSSIFQVDLSLTEVTNLQPHALPFPNTMANDVGHKMFHILHLWLVNAVKLNWKINFPSENKKQKKHPLNIEWQSVHLSTLSAWLSICPQFHNKMLWMESNVSATAAAVAFGQKSFLTDCISVLVCEWRDSCFLVVFIYFFIATHNCPCSINHRFANYIWLIASVFAGSQKNQCCALLVMIVTSCQDVLLCQPHVHFKEKTAH